MNTTDPTAAANTPVEKGRDFGDMYVATATSASSTGVNMYR